MSRVGFITLVFTIFFQPVAAQRSAWELLLSENPEAADDPSIGWQDRLVLHALTPDQARLYFSHRASAEELTLADGRSLAFFLEEKLNPMAHVYIPLLSLCPLFEIEGPLGGVHRIHSRGGDLSFQGGSSSGCLIAEEAAALLVQVQVESLVGFPARIKLWSPEGPEPAGMAPGQPIDFPLSYQTTVVVPVCAGEECNAGEFELKLTEGAAVTGQVIGYFRPLEAADQPGGAISLLTEGLSNNFFGTGAGASITTGFSNSFFGGNAGHENTSGSANSFFGGSAGHNNTSGDENSFFGSVAGSSNTTGGGNSFFGSAAGFSNTTGAINSFFGQAAGFSNTTGAANSFFGRNAGRFNTDGSQNSFFGHDAGFANSTGGINSFFGSVAGASNTTGTNNSFFGQAAGFNNTTGSNNSFFGTLSGLNNGTQSNNTFIGFASNGATGVNNATALGFRAQASQSNSLVLGSIEGLNGATSDVQVGIGTDMPAAPLHVQRSDGTIQIIRAQSTGPETVRNMMDLMNNGIPQFRLVDTSPDGDAWQFSNTNNNLNISLQGSGSQEFLIENDGDVRINNGTVLVTSSRATKENFNKIHPEQILKRLADLELSDWNYKKDPDSVRHLGPVSEDFYRLFGLGDGDKHITPTDLSGVALAAIQGLLKEISILRKRIARLESSQTTESGKRGEKSGQSVGEEE